MKSVSIRQAFRLSEKKPHRDARQQAARDEQSVASDGDVALLQRARTADAEALGLLYERYAARVYSYVLFRVGSQELAEDLTADVFVKMLAAVRASNAWQTTFTGWLYRIAHNAIIDHFRRKANVPTLALGEQLAAPDDDPVATSEQRARADAIGRALLQLTPEQQIVLVSKFYQGLTNVQIAREMDKTEGAVKSLQYRALGSMRRILGEASGEADE